MHLAVDTVRMSECRTPRNSTRPADGITAIRTSALFRCALIRMMVGGRGLVMAAGVTVCSWQRLAVSEEELNLDFTLGSGQAFLWRRDDSTQSWTGPIRNK